MTATQLKSDVSESCNDLMMTLNLKLSEDGQPTAHIL
jgi:hypothetical protein